MKPHDHFTTLGCGDNTPPRSIVLQLQPRFSLNFWAQKGSTRIHAVTASPGNELCAASSCRLRGGVDIQTHRRPCPCAKVRCSRAGAGHVWGWWGETGEHAWVAPGRACGVLKFTGVRLRGGLARLRPAPPGTKGDRPLLPGAIRRSTLGVLRSTPGGTKLERPLRLKGAAEWRRG